MLAITVTDGDRSAADGWRIAIETRDFAPHVRVLSVDERARCDAILVNGAADVRRAAHVLKREAVGAQLNLAPAGVAFAAADGCPCLLPPYDETRVSLSHTEGAVAVAVADLPVGIDVEVIDRADDPMRLAARLFAPEESRAIRASPDPHFAFASRWTAKEALLKACGLSVTAALSTPLGAEPLRRGDPPVLLEAHGALITVFSPSATHVCAVAKLRAPTRRTARTSR